MRSTGVLMRWFVVGALLAGCGQPVATGAGEAADPTDVRGLHGLAPAAAESRGIPPTATVVTVETEPVFHDAGLDDCLLSTELAAHVLGTPNLAAVQHTRAAGPTDCQYLQVDPAIGGQEAVLVLDVRNAVPAAGAKAAIDGRLEPLPGIGDAAGFGQVGERLQIQIALGDRSITLATHRRLSPEQISTLAEAALDGLTPYR